MIDAPGTVNWGASGINGSGSIVGTYNLTASPGTHHGFFNVGGNFTLIDAQEASTVLTFPGLRTSVISWDITLMSIIHAMVF